jgi:hypothetical protein
MGTQLTVAAGENSTYVVRLTFTDEDGAAETPATITWTLTDRAGTVVNSRLDVAVAAPASTVDIVLSGNDLALAGYSGMRRILTVEATYSSALGASLPLRAECWFHIEPLAAVP